MRKSIVIQHKNRLNSNEKQIEITWKTKLNLICMLYWKIILIDELHTNIFIIEKMKKWNYMFNNNKLLHYAIKHLRNANIINNIKFVARF